MPSATPELPFLVGPCPGGFRRSMTSACMGSLATPLVSNFAIDPIPKVDDFSRIITAVAAQESDHDRSCASSSSRRMDENTDCLSARAGSRFPPRSKRRAISTTRNDWSWDRETSDGSISVGNLRLWQSGDCQAGRLELPS